MPYKGFDFNGIEGPDLEVRKRKAILECSLEIPADDITQLDPAEPVSSSSA